MADDNARMHHQSIDAEQAAKRMIAAIQEMIPAKTTTVAMQADGKNLLIGEPANKLVRKHIVSLDVPTAELEQTIQQAFELIPPQKDSDQFVRATITKENDTFGVDIAQSPQLQKHLKHLPSLAELRQRTKEMQEQAERHTENSKSPIPVPTEFDNAVNDFDLGI